MVEVDFNYFWRLTRPEADWYPPLWNKLKWAVGAASAAQGSLYVFHFIETNTLRYFLKKTMHMIPYEPSTGHYYVTFPVEPPQCFYIGTFPMMWNVKHNIPQLPSHCEILGVTIMGKSASAGGDPLTDYERELLEELRDSQEIQTILQMINDEGKYDAESLYKAGVNSSEVEVLTHIMNELSIVRNPRKVQQYLMQEHVLKQWKDAHQACLNYYYPKQKKSIVPRPPKALPPPPQQPTDMGPMAAPTPTSGGVAPTTPEEITGHCEARFYLKAQAYEPTMVLELEFYIEKVRIY